MANFYPSITLGGSFGIQSLQATNLWTLASRQYSLGPSISIPIFEGGQLKSTLELAQGVRAGGRGQLPAHRAARLARRRQRADGV